MAIIYTYPRISPGNPALWVLVTDNQDNQKTKNISLKDFSRLIPEFIELNDFDLCGHPFVPVCPIPINDGDGIFYNSTSEVWEIKPLPPDIDTKYILTGTENTSTTPSSFDVTLTGSDATTNTVNIKPGNNVTFSISQDELTINSSGTGGGGSVSITDGNITVPDVETINFIGAQVSGTSPTGDVTITSTNEVANATGTTGSPANFLSGNYNKFNFVDTFGQAKVFAQEDANDNTQVNIFIPAPPTPTYPPYFNEPGAIVADPLSSFRKQLIVSDPNGAAPGNFETGGWDDLQAHSSYLFSNATLLQFKPGNNVNILGFSPAGAPAATGCKVQVKVFKADGVSLFVDETTGVLDQNTVFQQNNVEVQVSNYSSLVDPYGAPTQYQAKLLVKVNIQNILVANNLSGGRYSIKIIFTPDQVLPAPGTSTPKAAITYTLADVFADSNPTSPDTSNVVFVTPFINTTVISYLSGVKYLTAGSKFSVEADGIQGLNGNTQGENGEVDENLKYDAISFCNTNSVEDKAWNTITQGTVTGYNDVWDNTGVSYDYSNFTIQNSAHTFRGQGGNTTLRIYDPWNSATKAANSDLDLLILTFGTSQSNDLVERFDNETRRLSKPSLSGNYSSWNSQTALSSSVFGTKPNAPSNSDFQDACQVVDNFNEDGGKLISPNKFYLNGGPTAGTVVTNFNGYLPSQATNFTNFTKPSVYHRQFGNGPQSGSPIPSFALTFTGTWGGNSNINAALNNQDIKIYIRRVFTNNLNTSYGANTAVPLNLHNTSTTTPVTYYDPGTFTDGGSGIDTASATIRTDVSSGNVVEGTFGTGRQADIGMYMEIQYLNPDIKIESISCLFN
jgi:hypothetical protein